MEWLLILTLTLPLVWTQNNNNRPTQKDSYYLDSNADCNGPVRLLYGQTVKVKGHGAIQEQQGPTSCTLTLKSASNFDHTVLLLTVIAANINDCDVKLVMYDGDPGQGTLKGYDCDTPSKPNERAYRTTGDVVSFILERRNVLNTQYDIEIQVTTLVSGNQPGYENDYGDTWGFHREKLENDIAVGIVGAAFLLVLIIGAIVLFVCYSRYQGKNKPWEQHQLSTFRPAHSIYETKSKMSDTSSGVWATGGGGARGRGEPLPPPRRMEPPSRMGRPSEDEDSVFDDASDIAPKRYMMDQDRRWERDRQRERERERERGRENERPRRRGREMGSHNSSYVQADDDHPQDSYVERIIEPRRRRRQFHKPPSYDEAVNESDTEKSDIDDDDDDDDDDDPIRDKETSEEESEGEEEEEEASSEQEEEEEEDDEEDGRAATAKGARPRPQQRRPQQAGGPPPPTANFPPGLQPAYAQYPPPPMGYMGGAYPMGPGQFVPVMAAAPPHPPLQPQPVSALGPGHPPPRYPGQASSHLRPSDPPIYSYLVQRGYTPLDGGQDSGGGGVGGPPSHNSSHHSQSSGLDQPPRSNLASGVDYMTR